MNAMNDTTAPVLTEAEAAAAEEARKAKKHAFEMNKLSKRLHRQVGQAIADFAMIEDGDKVMVCLSGGKDSYSMLDILMNLQKRAPIRFEIVAVNLDQKQPGFPAEVLPNYLKGVGVPFHIETQDTYSIVKKHIPEGQTMCSLCSRLRRGILYRVARELGCNKIALGHHRDDMVVTLLMNMFFGSRMKGMPPKLVTDNGEFIVIRPLAYVAETDLETWAAHREFPIIPCSLCGNQDNLQRVTIKRMIREWDKAYPGRIDNMFTAMGNITLSHMMDRNLYPFTSLQPTGRPDPQGDKAFDEDEEEGCGTPPGGAVQTIRLDKL
ncbi:tRNA 2-thiocytidine(32) synthetase TtcA [Ideonella sp. B7]|uniref:tRNA 2-thiocytidine(32) synthetase TtcA n=1 Tax=Ideonella benzenivorans TaxID=2831643 RepID=UPI001CEC1F58|nr:tRNA 2-thiocytidine(32) synthetase TtcA [Ideonella benzenivorans]MCA6217256.1 tRNA 2-thiocytidine(32) synthetase TtcA [Ideonella benzenivorans]